MTNARRKLPGTKDLTSGGLRLNSGQWVHSHGFDNDVWSASADMMFDVELCNHRPIATNIAAIKVDASSVHPTMMFSTFDFEHAPQRLELGIVNRFFVKTRIAMRRPAPLVKGEWIEETEVKMDGLRVAIVDGFGAEHLLQVADQEAIVF